MSTHFAKSLHATTIAALVISAGFAGASATSMAVPSAREFAVSGLRGDPASALPLARMIGMREPPWTGSFVDALQAPVPVEVPAGDGSGRQTFEVLTASGYPEDANAFEGHPFSGVMPKTFFGSSIALDGDRLFVGAIKEFTPVLPFDAFGAGAVYCYKKIDGHWQLMQKLLGDDSVGNDQFGYEVGVSGNTLMVGAVQATVNGNTVQGAAYVFHFDDATGVWTQTQKLTAADGGQNDGFGNAIALQGGNALIAAVQAPLQGFAGIGSVYTFTESNGVWSQTGKLIPDIAAASSVMFYGWSIALDGSTALIGTPYGNRLDSGTYQGLVEAYDHASGAWQRTQVLTPCGDAGQYGGFGWSLALQGSKVVIGAPLQGTAVPAVAGAACVYENTDGDWNESSILTASDAVEGATFGVSVAMKDRIIAVAADPDFGFGLGDGVSYVFVDGAQTDEFAQPDGLAIAIDGLAIIGADLAQRVNVHDFPPQAGVAPSQLAFSLRPDVFDSTALSIANLGAGAELQFTAGDDGSALSQTASDEAIRGIGGTCVSQSVDSTGGYHWPVGTSDTAWWRRFSFDELPQVGASASIHAVTVGMDTAPAGAAFTINLYAMPHAVAFETIDDTRLTLIGTATMTAAGTQVPQTVDVPVIGTIDDTVADDLVVEYHVSADDSLIDTLPLFIASANLSPQTHPTFVSSPTVCAASIGPHPIPTADLGNVLMTVHLDPSAPSDACANPTTAPWLSVPSGAGVVAAGASANVNVDVDTGALAPGDYSATLCVKTSDAQRELVLVPVMLSVSADGGSGDTVFKSGFDATP